MAKIISVICYILLILPSIVNSFAEQLTNDSGYVQRSSIQNLRSKLLEHYKTGDRPVKNPDAKITVSLGMSIVSIDLDDQKQRMSLLSSLLISWKDDYLMWSPEENDGIERLHFDTDDLWTPDIALFNSATKASVTPKSSLPVLVLKTGKVIWMPPFTAEVPCQINISKWPSDSQRCTFRFGSWTHHGEQIDMTLHTFKNNSISLDRYVGNSKWKLINYTSDRKTSTYDEEKYVHIDFNITVKRLGSSRVKYVSHTTIAVLITVLLSYLLPLSFHLSRLIIHIFGLSVLILCDLVLFMSLPASGGPIPHVVAYYSGTIVLTSLSLVVNIVMITASFLSGPQKLLRKKLSSLLPISKSVNGIISEEVGYMHLQEEMYTINELNNDESCPRQPDPDNATITRTESTGNGNPNPEVGTRKPPLDNSVPTVTLQRVINGVFFSLFAIAYLIDYTVLISSVME